MRINYNATAMLAVNALNRNDANVSESTTRLSSGYKINRAKDNPSGYAMSRKMRAQIDGLMQARDNTDTGVNIIKAVDGALSEVHDMLQRINELAIKGANGPLSDGDRELVDEEMQKLKEEIQRMSETFEFNGKKLLDGSFQLKGYVDDELSIKVAGYNDRMRVGEYTFNLSGFKNTTISAEVNGATQKVKEIELYDKRGNLIAENAYDLWRKKVTVPAIPADPNETLTNQDDPRKKSAIFDPSGKTAGWGYINPDTSEWELLPEKWEEYVPAILDPEPDEAKRMEGWGYINSVSGEWEPLPNDWDKTVEVDNAANAATVVKVTGPDGKEIEPVYVNDANGTTLSLKGPNGFEIKLDIAEEFLGKRVDGTGNPETDDEEKARKSDVKINLTGLGAMTVQVGANEGQELGIEIPDVGVKGLGIELISTTTVKDALDAITRSGVAINRLSGIRSKLGAYQNRLEAVVQSNEINHENMTAAYSGILDTDMSEEYTRYSTYQILSQASTSVLAQANERPSQILQLLQ